METTINIVNYKVFRTIHNREEKRESLPTDEEMGVNF